MNVFVSGNYINVSSDLNDWIDYVFNVSSNEIDKAKELLQKAFDDWNIDDNAYDIPLYEYLETALFENGIAYIGYTKESLG